MSRGLRTVREVHGHVRMLPYFITKRHGASVNAPSLTGTGGWVSTCNGHRYSAVYSGTRKSYEPNTPAINKRD